MKALLGLEDGEVGTALICFTDIAGFARAAEDLSLEAMAGLLRQVCGIIARGVSRTGGQVVKYIGDASLLVFPESDTDRSVRELLAMKREIEEYFRSNHPQLAITFSAHLGDIIVVRLQPVEALDLLGDAVNAASLLGRSAPRGGFAISQEVHRRLTDETRGRFHPHARPPVYVAGADDTAERRDSTRAGGAQ